MATLSLDLLIVSVLVREEDIFYYYCFCDSEFPQRRGKSSQLFLDRKQPLLHIPESAYLSTLLLGNASPHLTKLNSKPPILHDLQLSPIFRLPPLTNTPYCCHNHCWHTPSLQLHLLRACLPCAHSFPSLFSYHIMATLADAPYDMRCCGSVCYFVGHTPGKVCTGK